MAIDAIMPPVALTRRQQAALPGSPHDRCMGVLKLALPAAAVAVLLAIIIWPLTKVQEFSFLLAKDKVAMATERLRIDNAVYRGETARGEAFIISAGSAVQRSSALPVVELKDLKARIAMAEGPAVVTAPSGRYFIEHRQAADQRAGDARFGRRLQPRFGHCRYRSQQPPGIDRAPVTGNLPIGSFQRRQFQRRYPGPQAGDGRRRPLAHLRPCGQGGGMTTSPICSLVALLPLTALAAQTSALEGP